MVHGDALPFEHQADAAITEPAPLGCDLTHATPDLRIIRFRLAPDSLRMFGGSAIDPVDRLPDER